MFFSGALGICGMVIPSFVDKKKDGNMRKSVERYGFQESLWFSEKEFRESG